MTKHVVQSPEWGEFKSKFGTTAIGAGGVQYTKHKLPFSNQYYAYCPKVDPANIQWEELKKSLEENGCFVINFDVPNVLKNSAQAQESKKMFEDAGCKVSSKNTFTKNNIILDISKSEEDLMANMHKKHRYNIKYAEKKGVVVTKGHYKEDFEMFYDLVESTAQRQKYLVHPKSYYQMLWELLGKKDMAHLLIAKIDAIPLAAWMLFTYGEYIYYPYGGSSIDQKNLHASNLLGWEAIKLGKQKNLKTFDMWGACKDINDQSDPEWGFSNFKLKFGGEYVEYIDSYDYILNAGMYKMFTFAYPKILAMLKALK